MLSSFVDNIEQLIIDNKKENEFGDARNYSKKTLAEFKEALGIIKKAGIYLHRIDYLVCSDDGEDDFHKRLKEDLEEL
jgi:hypothetical protein